MRRTEVAWHEAAGLEGESPMPVPATIQELEAGDLDAAAIDAFLEAHAFPLAEPPFYTFVYRGAADVVRLRHWIFGLATSLPFTRVGRSDVWYRTVEIPDDSRVEYKIEVVSRGKAGWVADDLNPQVARDPFGTNSVLAARGYEEPEWAQSDPGVSAGSFDELVIESRAFESSRRVMVYRPPGFRDARKYPLLVVHDGPEYLEYSRLGVVLDRLTAALEIPAMVVALVPPQDRMEEYAADERHARFVVEELLPGLEDAYPLRESAHSRGLMGASLGAVAAFDVARRHPDRFGALLLQSGSFAFTDIGDAERGSVLEPVIRMMNGYREAPVRVAERVFLSVGVYEPLVSENRALVPVLRSTGMDVRFVEARDGHNWENWRDRLRAGLSWLFPGPLWMVYE
ncbi:MAG: alpha/beta hydrolase-fold protein [Gemmatimonadota bacterium]|nr:alpha/beta hydrolase-fold protein [Gemmatimonadota bacterium]